MPWRLRNKRVWLAPFLLYCALTTHVCVTQFEGVRRVIVLCAAVSLAGVVVLLVKRRAERPSVTALPPAGAAARR